MEYWNLSNCLTEAGRSLIHWNVQFVTPHGVSVITGVCVRAGKTSGSV